MASVEARVGDFRPSRHGLHFPNSWPPGPTLRFGPLDPRWLGFGDAAQGLCGGMCFVVGDLWAARVLPPPDRTPPPNGSPRFRRIVHRQVESLDWLRLPLAFWWRAIRSDGLAEPGAGMDEPAGRRDEPARARGSTRPDRFEAIAAYLGRLPATIRPRPLAHLTIEADWPRIRARIDAGQLAMVGLVRARSAGPRSLVGHHQVVAYAYRVTPAEIRLAVYDPNHPDRDDVELVVDLGPGGVPSRLAQTTGEPLRGFFLSRYRPEPPGPWRPT